MEVIFSNDQIGNLKDWKKVLENKTVKEWKEQEERAEVEFANFLTEKNFQEDGMFNPKDFDYIFSLMRDFSGNRALMKLLYQDNSVKEFNQRLKNLYYGTESFPKRVDAFFQIKGIGTQTLSQFLLAFNPKRFSLITYLTKEALQLDAQQEQKAREIAVKRFEIEDPDDYLEGTIDYLRDFIVFEQIKQLLELEKYTSVNNLIYFSLKHEKELIPYSSVSLEEDLRKYLAKNPFTIEKGLKLIKENYDAKEAGKIDLLLKDKKGTNVVIELKKGKEGDYVVGQLLRYIGWIGENLEGKVQGIIIVNEPDVKLEYAVKPLSGLVKIKYYQVKFEVTDEYKGKPA